MAWTFHNIVTLTYLLHGVLNYTSIYIILCDETITQAAGVVLTIEASHAKLWALIADQHTGIGVRY